MNNSPPGSTRTATALRAEYLALTRVARALEAGPDRQLIEALADQCESELLITARQERDALAQIPGQTALAVADLRPQAFR